jgi:hypothetical protein
MPPEVLGELERVTLTTDIMNAKHIDDLWIADWERRNSL